MAKGTKLKKVFYKGDGGKSLHNFRKSRKRIMKHFRKDQVRREIGKIINSV